MKLGISNEEANIMHIDLNSAFATAEQQAHPSLRGKPVGVTNRKVTNYGCVIAASYEAKDMGVKVGMRIDEAKLLAPDLIMLESDPPKYHHMYQKLCGIMKDYVFKSVVGKDWYARLRGIEVDDVTTKLGNVGRQYVLDKQTADDKIIIPRFHYLCETTGKKLRYSNVDARGVLVWCRFKTGDGWYQRKMFKTTFFSDQEIYRRALLLFNQRPKHMIIAAMGITCYMLTPANHSQASLFEHENKEEWLTVAIDEINERYGNFVIHSANSLAGKQVVKQKIPFGGTKYFELLLKRA